MALNVLEFVAQPGRRIPIDVVLAPVPGEADDLRVVGEIHMRGQGFAQLATLYVDVEMTTTIAQPCGRCLLPIEAPFVLRESFTVPIPPTADAVDVRPAAISLLLSAHNPNVLCRPDCRGLCPKCGADLNEDPSHACPDRDPGTRRLGDVLRP